MFQKQPVSCHVLAAFSATPYFGPMMSVWVKGIAASAALVISATVAMSSERSVAVELEFPEETAAIVAATVALFDEVEDGEDAAPRRNPVIRMPSLATKASADDKAGALTDHGPLRHLTGYRISWYPMERFLGSIDYMGTWDSNRNLVCGYLTWDLSDPSAPVLEKVTANYLDLGEFAGATPAQIHKSLLEANCAFGAIDANYAFFEPAG